jgi:hypothetical protein
MPSLGAAVNFGFTGTDGIAATALTGKILLQGATYGKTSDEFQVLNSLGVLVTRNFFNPGFKATLDYVITGANAATAMTNTDVPDVGTIIDITACASLPGLDKTNWVVVSEPTVTSSNNGAARVSLSLESHASVTAAAT